MDVKRTLFWLFIFLSFSSHADVSKDGIYQDFRHYTDNVAHYDLRTISKAPSTLWQPLETRTPNYSFSTATHWIRIDFHNPTQTIFQGYLAVKTPHQDYISSLLLYDDGQQQEFYTGDRMPHNTRPMKHRHFHFPVK